MTETLTIEHIKAAFATLEKFAAVENPYVVVVNPNDPMIPEYKRLGCEIMTARIIPDFVPEGSVLILDKRKFPIVFPDNY